MEQFSLDKWLQDKSRKVVTRDGRPVRIVCWDLKSSTPIIAAIQWNQEREDCYCYNTIGRCANNVGELDIFFADEEEELTEFEQCLKSGTNIYVEQGRRMEDWDAKEDAKELLDIARKEIDSKDWQEAHDMGYEFGMMSGEKLGYQKGKQDALKDLPKWKKATGYEEFDNHILLFEDENRVVITEEIYKDEYYIELNDLRTLPKEE